MDIAPAVVDVQVFCRRIIPNRIRVLQEFHAREKTIGGTIENLHVSRFAIRYLEAAHVFAIKHCVRSLNSDNRVDQLAGFQVKYHYPPCNPPAWRTVGRLSSRSQNDRNSL